MRILVIARHFWPDLGGAQVQLRYLCEEWAAQGHDVTVLTCRWERSWKKHEVVNGYQVVRLPVTRTRFFGTWRYMLHVERWITQTFTKIDAVMVSMLKHDALAAARVLSGTRIPLFLKSWGAGDSGDMAWQRAANFGQTIRRGTLDVTGLFAPSPAVEAELRAAGYPRVFVVPNAVPIPSQVYEPRDCWRYRRELGWADKPTLVTTGRLSPEKGLSNLISAMPEIVQKQPNAQLRIVGEGPQRAELEGQIRALSLETVVFLDGRTDDVESRLRAADLYVLPSRFEGLSVALLEALVLGVACVASDTPANQGILPIELLPLFRTGCSRSIAEMVVRNLGEPSEEKRKSALALARQKFDISTIAEAHIQHFLAATDPRPL